MTIVSKNKVLFVGAGPSQMSAIQHAHSLGYEPYVIDADPKAVGFEFAVGFDVGDIRNPDFIIDCAKRYEVKAVVAIATDVPVAAVARACATLGFTCISVEAAEISVNKLLQRRHIDAAGLIVPQFMPFQNADEALAGAKNIGFPVVIKPSDASGSRGIRLVQNEYEVIRAAADALAASRTKVGLVEEYIDGTEVSVEGFVVDGIFHVICLSEKTRSPPPYMLDMSVHFPDKLCEKERGEIISVARKAVLACGLDNCPVHMELLRSDRGPVVVELAARGAGFRVFTNILPYVTGIDTIDVQLRLAFGQHIKIASKVQLSGAVIVFLSPIPGKLKSIKGLDIARKVPGVQEAEVYIEPGAIMGELQCGADRIGHLIVFAENRQEADQRAIRALSLIEIDVE